MKLELDCGLDDMWAAISNARLHPYKARPQEDIQRVERFAKALQDWQDSQDGHSEALPVDGCTCIDCMKARDK